jgi:hypothetical protein
MRCLGLFSLILLGSLSTSPLRSADTPPELAYLPANTLAYSHLQLRTIWNSSLMEGYRDSIKLIDAKTMAAFEGRFHPNPSTLDTFTGFAILDPQRGPAGGAIIRFTEDLDIKTFVKTNFPEAIVTKTAAGDVFLERELGVAFRLLNPKTLLIGNSPATVALPAVAENQPKWLKESIATITSGKNGIVLVGNFAAIPTEMIDQQVPPPFNSLFKLETVTMSMTVDKTPTLLVNAKYPSDTAAKQTMEFIKSGMSAARGFVLGYKQQMLDVAIGKGQPAPLSELPKALAALFAAGGLDLAEELLEKEYITRKGATLTLEASPKSFGPVAIAGVAIGAGLLLPAIQKVREAATRTKSQNNMKQIGLAFHNYESAYGYLPSDVMDKKTGKPLLSWRVVLLPYIEQENLYRQFKMDEPWDSEHNKPLSAQLPAIYAMPNQDPEEIKKGITHYRSFQGNGAMMDNKKRRTFVSVSDGTSNTIMVAEMADGTPWAKPIDIEYNPKKPLPKFKGFPGGFNATFGDGSVRFIRDEVPESILRALITADGGEVIDYNQLDNPRPTSKMIVPKASAPAEQTNPYKK